MEKNTENETMGKLVKEIQQSECDTCVMRNGEKRKRNGGNGMENTRKKVQKKWIDVVKEDFFLNRDF